MGCLLVAFATRASADELDGGLPVDASPAPDAAPPADAGMAVVVPSGIGGEKLAGYSVEGTLFESERDLRQLLDGYLAVGQPFTPIVEHQLTDILKKLHYELEGGVVRTHRAGGLWLVLDIHPFTAIRHVFISGNFPAFFSTDVRPRLGLRPGSEVEDEPEERQILFDNEAHHLEQWLAREGYYEARVKISASASGSSKFQIDLHVRLNLGPAYTLGKIKVTGNTSVPEDEILAQLHDHRFFPKLARAIAGDWSTGIKGGIGDFLGVNRYTKDNLNDGLQRIRTLYQQHGFPGVRVTTTYDPATSFDRRTKKLSFTIEINEKRKIDVAFEGNSNLDAQHLGQVLTFDAEGSYDDVEVANSAAAIRRRYQTEGFYQTTVTWERVRLLPTFERILFYINEGPRLRVQSITFVGNAGLSAADLAKTLVTRIDPGTVGRLFASGGYLTSLSLQQDTEGILALYHSRGYASATVSVSVSPDRRFFDAQGDLQLGALAAAVTSQQLSGDLHIRYRIVEGPHDVVTAREFLFDRDTLNYGDLQRIPDLQLKVGGDFVMERIAHDQASILRWYQEHGYLYAKVKSDTVTKDDPHVFTVHHHISEGPLVRLGKTFVRGNFRTRAWVIKSVLGINENDLLTLAAIRNGQDYLRQTGLFESVRLELLGIDESRVPLHSLVEVQERYDNHGVGEIGGGSSTQNYVFVTGTYGWYNMFGIGASFVLSGEYGFYGVQQRQYLRLDQKFPYWIVRHVTGLPLAISPNLSLYGFYRRELVPGFDYVKQFGGGFELSRQFRRVWTLSLQYNLVRKILNQDLERFAGKYESVSTSPTPFNNASVGLSLTLDRRTDARGNLAVIAPARGYKLGASALVASRYLTGTIFGDASYFKFGLSGQFLKPVGDLIDSALRPGDKIGDRMIFMLGLRYDQGVPFTAAVLPDTERFLAGGDTTVRGFEEGRLHTEVIRNPLLPGSNAEQFTVEPKGGNIRFIANLDLQVRVWNHSFIGGLPIASAIFVDAGMVTNSFAGFHASEIRPSIGVALARLVSPIGNFSIEYAIPIFPHLGDDPTGRFHFNLGLVF